MSNARKPFYRVYLIDDDQYILDLMEAMLDTEPDNFYQVTKFSSSPEALKSIFLVPPDLIILDVNMPVINGFEICQKLKSNPATCSVTVVLITAYGSRHAWYDGLLTYRADSYIAKPFSCESFIQIIQDVILLKKGILPNHKNNLISKSI